mmetsp:Transcript_74551/g.125711  ORF Transcript_74551/g.125711 Transcript_74551/m.125711 type:complete len:241 (+) Transcript_74551:2566-3288(+)
MPVLGVRSALVIHHLQNLSELHAIGATATSVDALICVATEHDVAMRFLVVLRHPCPLPGLPVLGLVRRVWLSTVGQLCNSVWVRRRLQRIERDLVCRVDVVSVWASPHFVWHICPGSLVERVLPSKIGWSRIVGRSHFAVWDIEKGLWLLSIRIWQMDHGLCRWWGCWHLLNLLVCRDLIHFGLPFVLGCSQLTGTCLAFVFDSKQHQLAEISQRRENLRVLVDGAEVLFAVCIAAHSLI